MTDVANVTSTDKWKGSCSLSICGLSTDMHIGHWKGGGHARKARSRLGAGGLSESVLVAGDIFGFK
jgi:hypothetical protein